ncbi:hypothetical protein Taro_030199 [Colocasia esculenta]|uniref:Uncharacterized protein n=1 Tax=Colocasia esculenta TaxID=4460 RepID=A0A843VX66_COLES|nr:hypothetical protein [Colocasia esculenta]
MDEHYIPILVTKLLPKMIINTNRSLTWALTVEGCTYNSRSTSICFLFDMKYVNRTLELLL